MKIFYHSDMDGKCAAHVVLLFEKCVVDDQTCQAINYGKEFPFDIIGKDERVYIVDYSIEPEDMYKLRAITTDVIWIDHHKSAIEKYEGFSVAIEGLRSIDKAGCELTWQYFSRNEVPEYVKLIGDRDTWTWKYGDRTKFFYAGLEATDTKPFNSFPSIWDELANSEKTVDEVTIDGQIIQRYKDITQQEYIKAHGFWVDFHGYRCFAVNGRFASQPLEAVAPVADIWIPFRYFPDGYWMVSLLTNKDIDVSEIAKQYEYHGKKGGGHKGAAGFECVYPPFMKPIGYDEYDREEVDKK